MFILFLVYTVMVYLKYKNKDKGIGLKLNRIVNDMAYGHLFFYVGALLVHVLTPKEFPVLLLYVYISSLFVEIASVIMEKPNTCRCILVVQAIVLIILYLLILTDDWCRFFLYRGHA